MYLSLGTSNEDVTEIFDLPVIIQRILFPIKSPRASAVFRNDLLKEFQMNLQHLLCSIKFFFAILATSAFTHNLSEKYKAITFNIYLISRFD